MKAVIIVLALYAAAASAQSKEEVHDLIVKCAKQVKSTPASFEELMKTRKIPATQEEKCFMGCLYKGMGLTKNGALDDEKAKKLAASMYGENPDRLTKAMSIVESCETISESDECILGYKLRECFITKSEDSFNSFLSETLKRLDVTF